MVILKSFSQILPQESKSKDRVALAVRNGYKTFCKEGPPVLNNLSMIIPKGSVYALLGSSGCGKTTAISCILGFLKLDKGEIICNPESDFHLQSNKQQDIGYMPQEMSLYTHLSIEETLQYFARLFGVQENSLSHKIQELLKLLSLSERDGDLVGNLSGGQQRRVSLAVALIHQPRLLILDEPTSGVDPLLRVRIWNHLRQLAQVDKVTILITSHYTEEARHAHMIGIMRDGRLVAEESPEKLLQTFNSTCLEQVILLLWKENVTCNQIISPDIESSSLVDSEKIINIPTIKKLHGSIRRIQALIWKNRISMWRNVGLFCFITVMPAVITLINCISFQNGVQGIPLAVVNNEAVCQTSNLHNNNNDSGICGLGFLSCKFFKELSLSENIRAIMYPSAELATRAVRNGDSYGIVSFSKNFTDAFIERILSGDIGNEIAWNESTIQVQLDQTNTIIYNTISSTLYTVLEKFLMSISQDCGQSPEQGAFSLQYQSPPLVGRASLGIIDFMVPGLSLGWLFFFPLLSTSIRLIGEKRQGTMSRTLTPSTNGQGTKLWEFLTAYVITESAIVFVQVLLAFGIMRGLFSLGASNPGNHGSIFILSMSDILAVALLFFEGLSGIWFGCLLGVLLSQEIQGALLSLAIFLPITFSSGLIWPVEGMPLVLQNISPFLPFTLPSEALRSILNRAWEFSHPGVWPGFLIVGMYTSLYIILMLLLIAK